MSTLKRYRIIGEELKKIVCDVKKDRIRFNKDVESLCVKYGFDEFSYYPADIASGMSFQGFCKPVKKVDRNLFKAPTKNGVYHPYVKHKNIQQDIKNIKDWSLSTIWDHINAEPHPFGGNMGIYDDEKLNNETLLYSYNDSFKGHEDLKEIKKSEYYNLIGE